MTVALVLGSAGAIGRATADELELSGMHVVRHARNGHGDVSADLTQKSDVRHMAAEVRERFGVPDIVLNCAGKRQDGLLVQQPSEEWMAVVSDNLLVAMLPIQVFLKQMLPRRSGCFVTVASVVGPMASPGQTAYAAAKAAVIAMMRSAAREYGARGIAFHVVCPGLVDSAMTDAASTPSALIRAQQADPTPVGVRDVARAMLYLASGAPTGQTLVIDRGISL